MCRRRTQSLILPNQDDSYKVGNKEGSHLQLCLLHNVVVNAVSDKEVDKDNVGRVDERDVLKVITWHTCNLAPLFAATFHFK